MNIIFKRDKNGNLIAYDKKTGKKIGPVSGMGDDVKGSK